MGPARRQILIGSPPTAFALAFGLVSLKQMRLRGEAGRGMARAGIVLGALGIPGGIVLILLIAIGASTSHQVGPG